MTPENREIVLTHAALSQDYDPDAQDLAAHWAPAVGGVGPMTRAMLLTNVVEMADRRTLAGHH